MKEETRSVVKEEQKPVVKQEEKTVENVVKVETTEKHSRYYQQSISNVIRRSLTRIVMLVNFLASWRR